MKKYQWLIAGIALLILTAAVVINVSARPGMGSECVEDGSCCTDPDVCTCG